jgi:hypothetical protein
MVDQSRQYTELLGVNHWWGNRWLFAVSWALFGSLMAGALAFCHLVEENRVPILGSTSWFLIWLLWIPLSLGISHFTGKYPLDRRNWKGWLPSYFLAGLVVVTTLLLLRVTPDRYFHVVAGSPFEGFCLRPFLVQSVVYDVFAFISCVALGHAPSYYRRWTERQVRHAEMNTRMAEIQKGFLKSQLQLRFLLNSLNLISGQLYGTDHRVTLANRDGAGIKATIQIPFKPAGAQTALATREALLDHSYSDRRRRTASA